MPNPTSTVEVRAIRPFREAKIEFEVAYLDRLLRETDGNMSEAARRADKGRKDFHTMCAKRGINPDSYRP